MSVFDKELSANPLLANRLSAGLAFLEQIQSANGGWPSFIHDARGTRIDWNCFTTALVCEGLAALIHKGSTSSPLRQQAWRLLDRGLHYLLKFRAVQPPGAYRFWSQEQCAYPGPDLDDTALALIALIEAGKSFDHLPDSTDLLELFGPYRVNRSSHLHPLTHWARSFPGVYTVWMNTTGETIVDACVVANVVRCLARLGAHTLLGYRESVAMLTVLLLHPQRFSSVTPYYPSRLALLWYCAQIQFPENAGLPEEKALGRAVASAVSRSTRWPLSSYDQLLLADARLTAGDCFSSDELSILAEQQLPDGGWPEGIICCQLFERLCWSSRAVTTALALRFFSRLANRPINRHLSEAVAADKYLVTSLA